jgi:hypothetical protein
MRHDERGNRTNAVIMACERLLFRSSPDKGRTGGVCSDRIGFLRVPQTPLNPPLSGGKWTNKRFSHILRRLYAMLQRTQWHSHDGPAMMGAFRTVPQKIFENQPVVRFIPSTLESGIKMLYAAPVTPSQAGIGFWPDHSGVTPGIFR